MISCSFTTKFSACTGVIEFTSVEQPKVAGVLLLGTGGMAPPHSTTFFDTACEIEDGRVIHPFAFRTHTHRLGIVKVNLIKDKINASIHSF